MNANYDISGFHDSEVENGVVMLTFTQASTANKNIDVIDDQSSWSSVIIRKYE